MASTSKCYIYYIGILFSNPYNFAATNPEVLASSNSGDYFPKSLSYCFPISFKSFNTSIEGRIQEREQKFPWISLKIFISEYPSEVWEIIYGRFPLNINGAISLVVELCRRISEVLFLLRFCSRRKFLAFNHRGIRMKD